MSKPQTLILTATFVGSCMSSAAQHRSTLTLAHSFPAVTSSISRSPRVLCFVFLYNCRFITQAARGSPLHRGALSLAPMFDSYAERYNDMIFKFTLLFLLLPPF